MCFKMKMPQIQMPSVTTTARDLVPQIESKEPESPIFGDLFTTAKKKGTASLKIDLKPTTNNNYSTLNY